MRGDVEAVSVAGMDQMSSAGGGALCAVALVPDMIPVKAKTIARHLFIKLKG